MLEIELTDNIQSIGEQAWDRLCGTDYPFLRYAFLHALEASGSVSRQSGWQPLHLQIRRQDALVGVMPLYLKSHSWGEYVFDWRWAEAYERHGLDYYPKLVTAIPFTPAWGPRFGTSLEVPEMLAAVAEAVRHLNEQLNTSSWHGLFFPEKQCRTLQRLGFSLRQGTQFHWFNTGYRNFDHYLDSFSSRKRKNLRKERQKILDQGIELQTLSGREISDALLAEFYRCYQSTYLKRGRRGYLAPAFFQLLRDRMPEQLVLVTARHADEVVATALSLRSHNTLYGRYWGCREAFDGLHFETCYYQGIEYCIREGLERFDPGAQGEHKLQRGFRPIPTWSAHWIREQGFREAIERFCQEEALQIQDYREELEKFLPFKQE